MISYFGSNVFYWLLSQSFLLLLLPVALQSKAGHGLILEVSRSHTHTDALQSLGLLWTSDQAVTKTSY